LPYKGNGLSFVGIIANPESGKDIRRLVAYGSVFNNQEKVHIVRRVLLGLSALGVRQICYMPDYRGIVEGALADIRIPSKVFPISLSLNGNQEDSRRACRIMEEQGVRCIITLGGDGTNRAVVKGGVSVPILPISTGTNNVFPYMIEGTVAGLAAGLMAMDLVTLDEGTFRSTKLEVMRNGEVADLALVDAVVYDDLFVGSRAIWEMHKVSQIFLNRADPTSIGISSIGGLIEPITPEEPRGLLLELGGDSVYVTAPIAPGLIKKVFVKSTRTLHLDEYVEISFKPSVLALDGEREIEIESGQHVGIRIVKKGPLIVDVPRVMSVATKKGILRNAR